MTKSKLSLMLAASMLATAGTASASDVDWIVAPYIWLPNISTDVTNIDDAIGSGGSSDVRCRRRGECNCTAPTRHRLLDRGRRNASGPVRGGEKVRDHGVIHSGRVTRDGECAVDP